MTINRSRGAIDVNLVSDIVGIASESTLLDIKSQTDKLNFNTNNFLRVATESDKITQQPLSSVTIAAGSTNNVDISVPSGKTGVAITLKATYNSSATSGVRLDIFYSPDGTNYDTDTDDSYTHPFAAGETKQKTYTVAAIHPYLRVSITNLDTTYSVTTDLWITFI